MSEAARSHRPDARLEPYMETPTGTRPEASDPLAELAQLVGQDDPFRNMFRQGRSSAGRGVSANPIQPPATDRHSGAATGARGRDYGPAPQPAQDDARALGLRSSAHEAPAWSESEATGYADEAYDPQHPDAREGYAVEEHYAQDGYAPEEMAIDPQDYAAPPLTPDLWAERGEGGAEPPPSYADADAEDPRAPRRPVIVLLAVLALTGGGLAATFLSRSGTSVAAVGKSTPTIMAASGPNKVKQVDNSANSTPEDADAALLNKNGASSGGPVKVVNSQEQPLDLAQLPKAANNADGGQADPAPSGSVSPFPEPRKVKTFLVRADGSMVSSRSAAPQSARNALPQFATGAVASNDANGAPADAGSTTSAAPRPATPKTSSHAATTPKAAPTSIADVASDSADSGAAGAKARQPASPGAKTEAKSKPVEVADASTSDATAPSLQGGGFSLQLAASPSEQDAREAFARLQKKYSELGGYKPVVKKADNGTRTVYRLRVGSLTQDQAKTLCSQLQASGGTCFVVRN